MLTKIAGLLALLLACCQREAPEPGRVSPPRPSAERAAPPRLEAERAPERVFVDTLEVPGDQPVFVLRGARRRAAVGVVLHGWCSHGMGFLQAFQWAAVEVGPFIALQGDHRCGSGPMRGWSNAPELLDRRIDAALGAYLGGPPPSEVWLVGSSQGVDIAVALARRFPSKYRALISASAARPLSAGGLEQLRGAYFFVGQHESASHARRSRDALLRSGVPAELHVIAGGGHADFHGQGDALLREAFRFLRR